MNIRDLRAEIGAVRFYWQALGVISGRCGHVLKGPKWTLWAGLREIAKSMRRRHRGELKVYATGAEAMASEEGPERPAFPKVGGSVTRPDRHP